MEVEEPRRFAARVEPEREGCWLVWRGVLGAGVECLGGGGGVWVLVCSCSCSSKGQTWEWW